MNDWIREIVANKQNYDFHIICSDKTTSKIDNDELNTNIQEALNDTDDDTDDDEDVHSDES